LVQPSFAQDIFRRVYLTGNIFNRCFQFPITAPRSNGVRFPQFDENSRAQGSRLGGIQSFWQNEADTLQPSLPTFQASEITTSKITVLIYITDELLQDSDALGRWAEYAAAQEIVFRVEQAIVSGSGAGQPLGILNSGALITVPEETGQASATVVGANIQKMMSALWSASYESEGTMWVYNQGLLPQLASLQTVVGTGGSESKLFQWATSPQSEDLLGGFPCVQAEACSVPGSVGDIILADFSRYILAYRELIRNEISLEVAFLEDSACFRAIWRINGQSIDKAPVTPFLGSQQTSPFVTLAARP
jgi:HK97 family phage major capsid protein